MVDKQEDIDPDFVEAVVIKNSHNPEKHKLENLIEEKKMIDSMEMLEEIEMLEQMEMLDEKKSDVNKFKSSEMKIKQLYMKNASFKNLSSDHEDEISGSKKSQPV